MILTTRETRGAGTMAERVLARPVLRDEKNIILGLAMTQIEGERRATVERKHRWGMLDFRPKTLLRLG